MYEQGFFEVEVSQDGTLKVPNEARLFPPSVQLYLCIADRKIHILGESQFHRFCNSAPNIIALSPIKMGFNRKLRLPKNLWNAIQAAWNAKDKFLLESNGRYYRIHPPGTTLTSLLEDALALKEVP
jgi:hypothetical protein